MSLIRIGIPNDISMQKCRKLHEPNENHAIPIVWSFQQVSGQKKSPLTGGINTYVLPTLGYTPLFVHVPSYSSSSSSPPSRSAAPLVQPHDLPHSLRPQRCRQTETLLCPN